MDTKDTVQERRFWKGYIGKLLDKCTKGKNISFIVDLKEFIDSFLQRRISNIRAKEIKRIEKGVAKYLKIGNYVKSNYRRGLYKIRRVEKSFVGCLSNSKLDNGEYSNTIILVNHIMCIYNKNKMFIHKVDLGRLHEDKKR